MNEKYTVSNPQSALEALDTRLPLLHSELTEVTQSLWDAAFNEGAKQGRQAGVESVINRLKKMAEHSQPNTIVSQQSFFRQLVSVLDPDSEAAADVQEYEEPTDTIRRKLEEKQRELQERAEFRREDYAKRCLYIDD